MEEIRRFTKQSLAVVVSHHFYNAPRAAFAQFASVSRPMMQNVTTPLVNILDGQSRMSTVNLFLATRINKYIFTEYNRVHEHVVTMLSRVLARANVIDYFTSVINNTEHCQRGFNNALKRENVPKTLTLMKQSCCSVVYRLFSSN